MAVFTAKHTFRKDSNASFETAGCLFFEKREKLLCVEKLDSNWQIAVSMIGNMGIIPSNYVVPSDEVIGVDTMLEIVDLALDKLATTMSDARGNNVLEHQCDEKMKKLLTFRGSIDTKQRGDAAGCARLPKSTKLRKAPPPPVSNGSDKVDGGVIEDRVGGGESESVIADRVGGGESESVIEGRVGGGESESVIEDRVGGGESESVDVTNVSLLFDPLVSVSEELVCGTHTEPSLPGVAQQEALLKKMHQRLSEELRLSQGHGDVRVAVDVVLTSLIESEMLSKSSTQLVTSLIDTNNYLDIEKPKTHENSELLQEMTTYLDELCSVKDDKQQRSWPIYEDEDKILSYVKRLTEIVAEAHGGAQEEDVKYILFRSPDDYVDMLVKYHQMESRWKIRHSMLTLFLYICSLHWQLVHVLVNTILIIDLCRDITTNRTGSEQFILSCKLLAVLFSIDTKLPQDHYFYINDDFFLQVLTMIEEGEGEGQVVCHLIYILLMFNYHHAHHNQHTDAVLPAANLIVTCLIKLGQAKVLTHELIYMLNEEVDIFSDLLPAPATAPPTFSSQQCVLKLLEDMFTEPLVAGYFYTNDVIALIGVISRKLRNLSIGDKCRSQYLSLLYQVVGHHDDYEEHRYQQADIQDLLNTIVREEDSVRPEDRQYQEEDQFIAKSILNSYPQYFLLIL